MARQIPIDKVRNVGLIAHAGAGKTTTTNRILQRTIKQGATVETIGPNPTIKAASVACEWNGFQINLIDTPGNAEFSGEVERSLRILDGAIVCFDGAQGVEPQSETVWRLADKHQVPRIAYINKMDGIGADFQASSNSIIKLLGANACPIQIPIGSEANFLGLIDLIEMKALVWKSETPGAKRDVVDLPEDMRTEAQKYRHRMIERIVEFDDALMERYLGGDENFTPEELLKTLRKGVLQSKIFPVLCGSSAKDRGLEPLLDAACSYLPSPADRGPATGSDPTTREARICKPDDEAPFAALVFKIQLDPLVGKLHFLRVYSGTLHVGDEVMAANNRSVERVGRLLRIRADGHEDIPEIRTGDIAVAVAARNARVGFTWCSSSAPVLLETIHFPDPVISVAIKPMSVADEERLANALNRLAEEDQTFRIKIDTETGQTIISGMGELHLEIIVQRIWREFGVQAKVGRPQVAYRETIKKKVLEEGKFIRQSGGRGQYGHCFLQIEPQPAGKGFEFVNAAKPGSIPPEFIPAVEKGVREALDGGALAGYPIVDIKVILVDGSFHEADSNEMAFKIAGAMALRSGCKKANPSILEPIMKFEAVTPEQYMGDVLGDLNGRRAKIMDMGDRGHLKFIRATVPLAEMFGYASLIRAISQGRASFTMEPSHYEEVPYDKFRASTDPHSPDEPPTAAAGRPVRPIRPKPGLAGGERKPYPPTSN